MVGQMLWLRPAMGLGVSGPRNIVIGLSLTCYVFEFYSLAELHEFLCPAAYACIWLHSLQVNVAKTWEIS